MNGKHEHKEGEECLACSQGIDKVREVEQQSIKKYGWFAHYVPNDHLAPFDTNYHTHGVYEKYGHPDFQVCLNVNPRIIHELFFILIDEVSKGKKYEVGKRYDEVLQGFDVMFIKAKECGRDVMRMILPDKNGLFENGELAAQYTMLDNEG